MAMVDPYVKFIEINRTRFTMIGEVTEGISKSRDLTEFVPIDNAAELLALLPTLEEPLDVATEVHNYVGHDSRKY
ncbi:hypothetical protein M0R45_018136 [Rubus argutus]|uniref:Uncharacterized protein n=1 Tax=Rubus argutus TaxID=59490 RepID=A0AAW1X3A8_RUBAR